MEPNKLEQEFRDKLEQRTIQPSKMAWDRLDAMLSVNEEKEEAKVVAVKRPNRNWMYMAASFVVFATIGTFFLTRESGNSTVPQGSGTSVVTVETPAPAIGSEDSNRTIVPPSKDISAPTVQQTKVASVKNPAPAPRKSPAAGGEAEDVLIKGGFPGVQNQRTSVAQNEPAEVVNANEANELIAAAAIPATKKKPTLKVDANSLLSSVEGELNESFRDKAFDGVVKNFNAVKTAVVNRNYQ